MKHFRPKGSPYFGTLEKITTITPESGQLIFGDLEWVGDNSDIQEFTVESLFDKTEPIRLPPVTEYRVTKKNGAFYELDTREAAERVAARESDTGESLEIVERTYRPLLNSPSDLSDQLRVPLPPGIKSVDIFQVFSVAASTYGVFGYFAQFVEPDPEGIGYREQTIRGLSMSTSCIMVCDAAEAGNIALGEDGWSFQGKHIEHYDDASYDSEYSSAIVLDDGNPRGILVATTSGSGTYDFRAVYEGEDDEATLIGILVLTSTAGPQDFSEQEILEKDWGDGVDERAVAFEYEEQGDYENAFRWYEISAKQGNPYGQSYLGQFYQVGLGVEKDETEAVKWFRLAAEQGNATGLWELGDCYQQGQGVEKDLEKAFEYFWKSLDVGDDSRAISSVGHSYLDGIGVEKDVERALALFREYAENDCDGTEIAQFKLGWCYLLEEYGVQDFEEAAKWLQRTADHGHVTSQYFLGQLYQDGDGVEQNYEEAIKWFGLAAEQGDKNAQESLAECYLMGEGVKQDFDKALQWFSKGRGEDVDLEYFFALVFDLANENGSTWAMRRLSECYRDGIGVEKNPEEADKWLAKAKELEAEWVRPLSEEVELEADGPDSEGVKTEK